MAAGLPDLFDQAQVTEARAAVGPVDLAYLEAGSGGRPLLLVHGFCGAKEDFGDWMDALADAGWWVVAPDLRGHGTSSKPPTEADYSFALFVADLEGLVDHLGWGSFALLGHSMGGAIAQDLALADPARIDRLVLMDTHHGAFEGLDPAVVQTGVDLIRSDGLAALLEVLDAFASPRTTADQRARDTRSGYAEWNDAKLAAVAEAMYASMAMALVTRPDRLAELADLDVATLVLVGEQDRDLRAAAERMGATVPGARYAVITEAAHSPQFENPDAWWQAVSSFLSLGRQATPGVR